MSFYAKHFVYNGIPSSQFGLRITSGDDSTEGADVDLITQEVYKRPKPYFYGVQQKPVLKIPISINVEGELSANESSIISNWLFGSMNYRKLQILQPDMEYVYYNCIFTNPQVERVGNIIRGYTSTIICDSPFAWEYPKNVSYYYASGIDHESYNVSIINNSDNPDYTYPTITLKTSPYTSATMNYISITNTSDDNRLFYLDGLVGNEIITIDNDIQVITSYTHTGSPVFSYGSVATTRDGAGVYNEMPSFSGSSLTTRNKLSGLLNYKWFRLLPGENIITFKGNISCLSFTYQQAKKVS